MKNKTIMLLSACFALIMILTSCAGQGESPAPDSGTAADSAADTAPAVTESPDTTAKTPEADPEPLISDVRIEDASEYGHYVDGYGVLGEGDKFAFLVTDRAVYTYPEPWKYEIRFRLSTCEWDDITLEDAVRLYGVTAADLDAAGIEYIEYKKGSPEYEEYYAFYAEKMTAAAISRAVGTYAYTGWELPLEFETGDRLSDDDLMEFFDFVVLPSKFARDPAFAQYDNGDGRTYDIPVPVYEEELKKYFNVTFDDIISDYQSMTTPGALTAAMPRVFEGGPYVETYGDPAEKDGVYVCDCYRTNYGYQGLFYFDKEEGDVFAPVAAVTFTLGFKVNDDFTFTYQFCRNVTEHYYKPEDFDSLVPGKSTSDDLLAIAPETVFSNTVDETDGNYYAGYSMGNEDDAGRILVTVRPDGVIDSVRTAEHY